MRNMAVWVTSMGLEQVPMAHTQCEGPRSHKSTRRRVTFALCNFFLAIPRWTAQSGISASSWKMHWPSLRRLKSRGAWVAFAGGPKLPLKTLNSQLFNSQKPDFKYALHAKDIESKERTKAPNEQKLGLKAQVICSSKERGSDPKFVRPFIVFASRSCLTCCMC